MYIETEGTTTRNAVNVVLCDTLSEWVNDHMHKPNTVGIAPCGEEQNCMIYAPRDWADRHREQLREINGYCDFAYNFPEKPAEIQLWIPAWEAYNLVKDLK